MALDRKALLDALEARIRAKVPGLVTVDRKLRTWDDVPREQQPACFIVMGQQTPSYGPTVDAPPIWRIKASVYLYARYDTDPGQPPGDGVHPLVNALEAALERQPGDVDPGTPFRPNRFFTTLGGRCAYARICDTIDTDEGALGDQAVAIVPIEMTSSG